MLALVLACAFMVAWIRSTITYDSIEWNGNPYRFYMESCLNRLHLNCTSHLENEPRFSLMNMKPKQVWGYKKDKETGTESYDPIRFNHDRCDWRCEIAGLHVIRGRSAFNDVARADLEFVLCIIPHWYFAILLTLLSAYLPVAERRICRLRLSAPRREASQPASLIYPRRHRSFEFWRSLVHALGLSASVNRVQRRPKRSAVRCADANLSFNRASKRSVNGTAGIDVNRGVISRWGVA